METRKIQMRISDALKLIEFAIRNDNAENALPVLETLKEYFLEKEKEEDEKGKG